MCACTRTASRAQGDTQTTADPRGLDPGMKLSSQMTNILLNTTLSIATLDVKDRSRDKIGRGDCPDQSHWIFIGVLCGLVIGIAILWFFNCFRLSGVADEQVKSTSEA